MKKNYREILDEEKYYALCHDCIKELVGELDKPVKDDLLGTTLHIDICPRCNKVGALQPLCDFGRLQSTEFFD